MAVAVILVGPALVGEADPVAAGPPRTVRLPRTEGARRVDLGPLFGKADRSGGPDLEHGGVADPASPGLDHPTGNARRLTVDG